MKNLIRPSILDRTLKGGDELEAADVEDIATTFLYKQGDTYVFMNTESFEQYELSGQQVDENWKYLTENLPCGMLLFNGNPIALSPPSHVQMEVVETEPGTKGDTATSVTKPAKVQTGAEFSVPGFIKVGNVIKIDTRDRRVRRTRQRLACVWLYD